MAKSSTSKKSTSKKTSKVAKTTAAAKTKTKKTVAKAVKAKKSVAVKVPAKKASKKRDAWSMLRALHVVQIVSAVAFGALTVLVMKVVSKTVMLPYVTRDQLTEPTELGPALRNLYGFDLRWALIALLGLGALYSLVVLTKSAENYKTRIANNTWGWRWLVFGLLGAIVMEIVALLNGIYDVFTLKFLVAVPLLSAGLILLSERLADNRQRRFSILLALVASLVALGTLVSFMVANVIHGGENSPWYVYAATGLFTLSYALTFANHGLRLSGGSRLQDPTKREQNYILISLFTQVVLAAILVIGLKK